MNRVILGTKSATVTTLLARLRSLLMGPQVVYVTVYRLNPVVSHADLAAALRPYGKVLNVSQPSWRSLQHIKTGMRLVKMEMAKAVPNFMKIRGFKAQFEYKGVRRVCARCGQSGHQVSNCKTPWCGRCSEYGHDEADCNAKCRRCKGNHATADCLRPRSYADAASNFSATPSASPSQQALESASEFPELPCALSGQPEEASSGNIEALGSASEFPELPRSSSGQPAEASSGSTALGDSTAIEESTSDSQEMDLEGYTSPSEEAIAPVGEGTSSSSTDTSLFTSLSSTESSDTAEQPQREQGHAPVKNTVLSGTSSGSCSSRRKEKNKPGTSAKTALASKPSAAGLLTPSASVLFPPKIKDPGLVRLARGVGPGGENA